jgi:hypothetical protein
MLTFSRCILERHCKEVPKNGWGLEASTKLQPRTTRHEAEASRKLVPLQPRTTRQEAEAMCKLVPLFAADASTTDTAIGP